jgi:hypothetical protein
MKAGFQALLMVKRNTASLLGCRLRPPRGLMNERTRSLRLRNEAADARYVHAGASFR